MLEITDIKKLFAVLQARYGHRFTSWMDDPDVARIAVSEWHRELKGFRPEDIRRGLETLPDDWPPTLMQFAKACLPDLKTLGLDVAAEVNRRSPKYYWEPGNFAEAARREKTKEEITEKVTREFQQKALEDIQLAGMQNMLNVTPKQMNRVKKQ